MLFIAVFLSCRIMASASASCAALSSSDGTHKFLLDTCFLFVTRDILPSLNSPIVLAHCKAGLGVKAYMFRLLGAASHLDFLHLCDQLFEDDLVFWIIVVVELAIPHVLIMQGQDIYARNFARSTRNYMGPQQTR